MELLFSKKILFVGGKGGVGKSTSAAAIAILNAKKGNRTLLVSTDPAHNTGDIFHEKIGNNISEITPLLDALEIDPAKESKKYIQQVKDNIKGLVRASMIEEVHRQIDTASSSPGADEAALFDAIVTIIIDHNDTYDTIIFDTAPTGHTIRLLTLPELMGVWIEGMLDRRKKTTDNYNQIFNDGEPIDDPIFKVLQTRKKRFSTVRDILLSSSQTGFIFVLNPERLPILETEKAIKLLNQYHLHVNLLIINKVLPEEITDQFFQKRKLREKEYINKIEQTFKSQEKLYIPLLEEDISSLSLLENFSEKILH
ncbi:ArsA family ATPase [Calidifontibacillus oryziterrae]|uniref:ArsA family ATPase n=1 Tax=Calidifontibacillus oryziterrae TaxID=1191699 RepID=UPI000477C7CE|nr:ArsA family ATPase [Calidifontibacillus oryziterrae]